MVREQANREVLDAKGLADYLGCAYAYACHLIKKIGYHVSARRYLVHIETVRNYMESNSEWKKNA